VVKSAFFTWLQSNVPTFTDRVVTPFVDFVDSLLGPTQKKQ
jgi:hypothetical protein